MKVHFCVYTTPTKALLSDGQLYMRQTVRASRTFDQPVLSMPLDPVQLPRRPCVRLRVLPAYRQTHRVSPADVTPNHPLVSNVLPHLALQVRLYLQPAQRVRALSFDSRKRRRRRVELRQVCASSSKILQGS